MSDININDYNLRYCKHCGGPLLNGKCTKCGKSAFPQPKVIITILSIFCVISILFNIKFYNELSYINNQYKTRFTGYSNPVTGEPINNAEDYLNALDAQMYIDGYSESGGSNEAE